MAGNSRNDSQSLTHTSHFLLRRLHSLSGIVPVGVFVFFHLFTNMQMAFGGFQHEVNWIHSLPALLFLEIFGLWLPIAFHAGLGIVYTFTGESNVKHYRYGGNVRYALQRITGMIALVFIVLHVATLRWGWNIFGWYSPFFVRGVTEDGLVVNLAHYSTAVALSHWLILLLYVVGVLAAIFHLANGLWTAAITWGLTVSVPAQKRWGYVCGGAFAALLAFMTLSIYGAVAYVDKAPEKEKAAYAYMVEHPDLYHHVHEAKPGERIDLKAHDGEKSGETKKVKGGEGAEH